MCIGHKICAAPLSKTAIWNTYHCEKYLVSYNQDAHKNTCIPSVKCPLLSSNYNKNWNLPINFCVTPENPFSGCSTYYTCRETHVAKVIGTLLQTSVVKVLKIKGKINKSNQSR